MCPDVRVHVRLGAIRLDYEGDQAFYEGQVESLVGAAAQRGRSAPPPVPAPAAVARVPAMPAPVPGAPVNGAPAPAAVAPRARAWSPTSAEFGRFVRRLGPDTGTADRQIVAFAFYLWNYEREETFGRAELAGCFQALHLPVPENLDELLVDVTERKRFFEPESNGRWRLSKKGENYVKTRLLSS